MTTQERMKLAAEAKRAAEEDYNRRLSSLDLIDPNGVDDPMCGDPFGAQLGELKGITYAARRNTFMSPVIVHRHDLLTILTLPNAIVWREWTDETEEDPVSGNPRPKMVTRRQPTVETRDATDVRLAFAEALLALTGMARRIKSETYAALRAVYLRVNAVMIQQHASVPFDADWTEDVLSDLERVLPDLKADVDITVEAAKFEGKEAK